MKKGLLPGFETRKAVSLSQIEDFGEKWHTYLFAFGVGTGGNRLLGTLANAFNGLGLQSIEIYDPDHVSLENQQQGFDFVAAMQGVSKAVAAAINVAKMVGPGVNLAAYVQGVNPARIDAIYSYAKDEIQSSLNNRKIPLIIFLEMIDVTESLPILQKVNVYKLAQRLAQEFQIPIIVVTGLDAGAETTGSGVLIFTGDNEETKYIQVFGNILKHWQQGDMHLYPPIAFLAGKIELLLGNYGVSPEAAAFFRHQGGLDGFPQTVHASATHAKDIVGILTQIVVVFYSSLIGGRWIAACDK